MNIKDLIEIFINNSIFIKDYESTDKIINNVEHDYNKAKSVSSQITKTVKLLVSSESGLAEFIKLLDSKNLVVASSAAEYLYPLYPQKCLKILKKYSNSLSKLDSYKVNCMIEGLVENKSFFTESFKKLYNCDDLDSLNREKKVCKKTNVDICKSGK